MQLRKWLLIMWIFQAMARGYSVPPAFWAAPRGDRCSCRNDPEETTKGFLRVPGKDGIQEQHQENESSLPPSSSLGLRNVPWTEVSQRSACKISHSGRSLLLDDIFLDSSLIQREQWTQVLCSVWFMHLSSSVLDTCNRNIFVDSSGIFSHQRDV